MKSGRIKSGSAGLLKAFSLTPALSRWARGNPTPFLLKCMRPVLRTAPCQRGHGAHGGPSRTGNVPYRLRFLLILLQSIAVFAAVSGAAQVQSSNSVAGPDPREIPLPPI